MRPGWRITAEACLRSRNTFGVAAVAPWLVEVEDPEKLAEVFALPQVQAHAPLLLGGGSNLLFAGNPEGAVITLDAHRIQIIQDHPDGATLSVDAGVQWHTLVMWTLQRGLVGLENLALIPGTTGAAPIQNIGAYGTEAGEFIQTVVAFDRETGLLSRLAADACGFAYRDSVFKRNPDQYIVTAVEFRLPRRHALRMDYAGIADELAAMGISHPDAMDVANAVIRIRRRKLPDPELIGNAGSFFKNPMVSAQLAQAVALKYPALPSFRGDAPDMRKLSAAWMIDACGWKGFREGDAGVADSHALVLVNHGQASGAQLLGLARRIADSVHERFGVWLEPEPKLVGAQW